MQMVFLAYPLQLLVKTYFETGQWDGSFEYQVARYD